MRLGQVSDPSYIGLLRMEIKACSQNLDSLRLEYKKLQLVAAAIDKEFRRLEKITKEETEQSAVGGQINLLHFNSQKAQLTTEKVEQVMS